MGLGKDAAKLLKEQEQLRSQKHKEQLERNMLTTQKSDSHWDSLVSALQAHVAEFCEHFPRAKAQQLRADLLNENNLTIRTHVQPILKVEVLRNYPEPGVHADIIWQHNWDTQNGSTPYYQFCPEGFTDGVVSYSPNDLAENIFRIVVRFFSP